MPARIPEIDLSPLRGTEDERRALANKLTAVYHDIGFAVLVNHGLPTGYLDTMFAMMAQFFALPDAQKLLIDKRESRHFRGWEAVGTEFTNNRPDVREQIDIWSERPALAEDVLPAYLRLLGPNQWMPDHVIPAQKALTLDWFNRLGTVADEILSLFALGLGLEADHFHTAFDKNSMSLMKFISYPPTPEGAAGVNAHHDTGFVTLLAAGPTPGLQVLDPTGDWIDVPVVPDSFVLNIGEMLQAMTGNYLVATAHRVITSEPRMSTAYFHGPSLHTALDPIQLSPRFIDAVAGSERHRSAGFMTTKEQTAAGVRDMGSTNRTNTYGEQLWNYFARSYPDMMQAHYG
ncbi:MAG: 2-oxoglutarate and iron-dependent oxygenase domain-containing protein [Ilumatobacter sp.]|nr:2-oxoglutarate and iron-dependent oxygenase domain-containing protein [Ilumatobacter sp.]